MNGFDLVFGFFSVLIAFAFAELLSGFVFSVRAKLIHWSQAIPVALAGLVLVDLVTFWSQLWSLRAFIPPAFGALLITTIGCSLLFIAAKLVLPQDTSTSSLESHFYSVRRIVIGCLLAANLAPLALFIVKAPFPITRLAEQIVWAAMYVILAVSQRKWLLWCALGVLILIYGQAAWVSLSDFSAHDLSATPAH